MKRYDSTDLTNPATYEADPALMQLAGRVAAAHYETHGRPAFSRGGFRQAVQAGHFPELMRAAVNQCVDEEIAQEHALAAARESAATLVPPAGYTVQLEDKNMLLSGPWSDDLHIRIKRLGGQWDGQQGQNRRLWVVPIEKAASLQRVFGNSTKALEKAVAEKAAAKKADEERRAAQRVVREQDMRVLREEARQRREQERAERAQRVQQRVLFPCANAPALQQPMRWCGKTVVFESTGERFRINENHPSTHGAHLLGYEGDWGRYHYYRLATETEAAALEQAHATEAARVAAETTRKTQLAALRDRIKAEGERPPGLHQPEGERLADTQTLYGGGHWFVVGPKWIWYIQNNGADGDDWSLNNVVTGGAGAIGWRIPYSVELAEQLHHVGCP